MMSLQDLSCEEVKSRPALGVMSRHQSVEKHKPESPDIILGAAGLQSNALKAVDNKPKTDVDLDHQVMKYLKDMNFKRNELSCDGPQSQVAGSKVAVKTYDSRSNTASLNFMKMALNEIEHLKCLRRSEYVVKLLTVFHD
jgi:hypothetical protein